MNRRPPRSTRTDTLFPYTTLFRSERLLPARRGKDLPMNGPDFIQNIRLDRLVKSPRNVRKTPSSGAADAELKASIAVHGLQQNLVVTPANGDGAYEVIAGGRRLAALKALQAEGKLPADCLVPCFIRTESAAELSLAENIVRQAMHPADQFEAFRSEEHTSELQSL